MLIDSTCMCWDPLIVADPHPCQSWMRACIATLSHAGLKLLVWNHFLLHQVFFCNMQPLNKCMHSNNYATLYIILYFKAFQSYMQHYLAIFKQQVQDYSKLVPILTLTTINDDMKQHAMTCMPLFA